MTLFKTLFPFLFLLLFCRNDLNNPFDPHSQVNIYDSTVVRYVLDSIILQDTALSTLIEKDTLLFLDTVVHTDTTVFHDTVVVPRDSVITSFETLGVYIDTLDTVITVYDTTVVVDSTHDTITFIDSSFDTITVFDTVAFLDTIPFYDTTEVSDTTFLFDTTFVFDTSYVTDTLEVDEKPHLAAFSNIHTSGCWSTDLDTLFARPCTLWTNDYRYGDCDPLGSCNPGDCYTLVGAVYSLYFSARFACQGCDSLSYLSGVNFNAELFPSSFPDTLLSSVPFSYSFQDHQFAPGLHYFTVSAKCISPYITPWADWRVFTFHVIAGPGPGGSPGTKP